MLEFLTLNQAALINGILLFCLFAAFHSACAQLWFKDWLARLTSPFFVDHFWRIIYVYISIYLYFVVANRYLYSHITPVQVFEWSDGARQGLSVVSTVGYYAFILVLVEIDFLHYFGLKQATRGLLVMTRLIKPEQWVLNYSLKTSYIYRVVRHPLYFSLMMMLLPTLETATGVLIYLLLIIYLCIGLPIEERKLIKQFGNSYEEYRKITPAVIPLLKRSWWRSFNRA